tara:strand:- start:13 stop:423 length:411 start_codon:yes stop_codon:yes gene_type:complete
MSIKFSEFTAVTDFTELVGLSASDNGKITKADLKTIIGLTQLEGMVTSPPSGGDPGGLVYIVANNIQDILANTLKISFDSASKARLLNTSGTNTGDGQLLNVTTTERDAISSPNAGLMIFNTTTSTTNFYNGSAWV